MMPLEVKRPQPFYCSFCGKNGDEVIVLIAGPTVFICDECVEMCRDIVGQYRIKKADGARQREGKEPHDAS